MYFSSVNLKYKTKTACNVYQRYTIKSVDLNERTITVCLSLLSLLPAREDTSKWCINI